MNKLKQLRKLHGLTQKDVATICGIQQNTYSNWERGEISPNIDCLKILSKKYCVSIDYILGNSDDPTPTPAPTAEGSQWIPIRGSIAAGMPIETIEEAPDPTDIDQWEEISADTARRGKHIALRIKGASMAPYMEAGDIAIVRLQPDAESGEIAVVFVDGDSATVKKIKKENGGIWLLPINEMFPSVYYKAEQVEGLPVKIIGVVVELRRKIKAQ